VTISERIKGVLDLLKADSSITTPVYSDGVLEVLEVPAIYVAYRDTNYGTYIGDRKLIDLGAYSVKVYSESSSEAIDLAEKVKNCMVGNDYMYENGVRMKDDKYHVFVMEFRKFEVM